jgi:hypothetical protein
MRYALCALLFIFLPPTLNLSPLTFSFCLVELIGIEPLPVDTTVLPITPQPLPLQPPSSVRANGFLLYLMSIDKSAGFVYHTFVHLIRG